MRSFFLVILVLLIDGCTLRPLVMNDEQLKKVEIRKVVSDSPVLRGYLLNLFDFYNADRTKDYIIDVVVTRNVNNSIIQKDSSILEKRIILNSSFVLYDKKGKELIRGNEMIAADYGDLSSPYGSYLKEQKIYHEALKQVAEDIKRQVMIYFLNHKRNNESTVPKH